MTLQLGRLALPDDTVDVSSARSGDQLQLGCRAWVTPNHPLREQILGLAGRDLAVSWTHDRTWAGFYRVGRPSLDIVHLDEHRQVVDFSVALRPLMDSAVDFESTLVGDTLTNAHGLAGGVPWIAPPAHVDDLQSSPLPTGSYLRAALDGPVTVWTGVPLHAVWSVDPAGFYAAAAEVRQNLAVLTGLQSVDPPGIFQLSNGLCRVRWIVGEVNWDQLDGTWDDFDDMTWEELEGVAGVQVAVRHGGQWVNKTWDLGVTPDRVAVLRNDAHAVTVRLVEELSPGRRTLDLTLRRGARAVHGHIRGPVEIRTVMRADAEAAVEIDGGVRAADADADEVFYVAGSTQAHDVDLAQGGFTRAGADRLTFMVGGTPGGIGQTATELIAQWISHVDETVRAVRR